MCNPSTRRALLQNALAAAAAAGLPGAALADACDDAGAAPALTHAQARALIEGAVATLLDPKQDVALLSRYFASNYTQEVDGKALDHAGFIDHARTLKASLRGGRATIETLIVDGSTIADIHVVDAEKANGDTVQVRVIAFFTVRDGKIVRVDELTRLLHGAKEDHDLGSRTSGHARER